jgi:hypothetical protein
MSCVCDNVVKQNRKPSLSICVRSLRPEAVTSRFHPDEHYRLRLEFSTDEIRYFDATQMDTPGVTSVLLLFIYLFYLFIYLFIYLLGALSHY